MSAAGNPTPTDRIDRDQRMMFFYEIGVSESHRRRGVGRRMIAALKSVCREENAMKVWVLTARSNIAATALYASTGAAPLQNGDEVTYAYPRESFAGPDSTMRHDLALSASEALLGNHVIVPAR